MEYYGSQKLVYDEEVEASVIATMLNDEHCFYDALASLTPDHFFVSFYRLSFEIMGELAPKGRPTFRELTYELNARKKLDHDRLAKLEQVFASSAQFDIWLDKLRDMHIRREYRKFSYLLAEMSINETASADEIVEFVEAKIVGLSAMTAQDEIFEPGKLAEDTYDQLMELRNNPQPVPGMSVCAKVDMGDIVLEHGFPGINDALGGFQRGDMIVLAAQSGHGKTAFAQNIARLLSVEQEYYTFYQNTEMMVDEMMKRFASQMSGVPFKKIYTGFGMSDTEWQMVANALERFKNSHLYLSYLPTLTPQKSKSLARKFKLEHGRLDLLIIDYIGRMELEFGRNNLREDQVLAQVAREAKKLAQELQCAVLLLAQLNEEGRIEGARRIKNDADAVFFLEPANEEDKGKPPKATHKLIKYKVRRGETGGALWIEFKKPTLYMTEVTLK